MSVLFINLYIIFNLYIQVCCAIYDYAHNNGMCVVGKINTYLEKNIQSENVKMNLETSAQVGKIKACCVIYNFVHNSGMRVVGKIYSYLEIIIRSEKIKLKWETIAQVGKLKVEFEITAQIENIKLMFPISFDFLTGSFQYQQNLANCLQSFPTKC